MGERIKNALFNSLGSALHDADVLDAFAGSGALGIEALSRGARSVAFIEKDRIAQRIIESNVALLRLNDNEARLIKGPVASVIATLDQTFTLIFADPPYHDPQLSTVSRLFDLLAERGVLVLSHPKDALPEVPEGINVIESRTYGTAHITYYQKG